jgi:hypothetical protein
LRRLVKDMASFFYILPYPNTINNIKTNNWNNPDVHGHGIEVHSSHGPEGTHQTEEQISAGSSDIESNSNQEGKEAATVRP